MQIIGVTGGAGAGKSVVLEYLEQNYKVKNLEADKVARMLMEPETDCYLRLQKFLPAEVYNKDETINREALAEELFASDELRRRVNDVVHPAVKNYILAQISEQEKIGVMDFVVIEAALLIEEHYEEICDELWYIHAEEEIRRQRLIHSRGYSREKVERIFASQLPEKEYRRFCRVVIDNNGTKEETYYQVAQEIKDKGEMIRMEQQLDGMPLVFGLDIGTRNVVGTVGYKEKESEEFIVVAQHVREHAG